MSIARFPVSVVMECVPLANRWVSERWQPAAVEIAGSPEGPAESGPIEARLIARGPEGTAWRFTGFALELHRSEAEGYYLNLTAPAPKVFVMWRHADDDSQPAGRPQIVTVSYNEAARMLDGGAQVDAVTMPPAIFEWLKPFVAAHYTPEPRKKVRRNDPFADGAFVPDRRRPR